MEVKALRLGFFGGQLRPPGALFDCPRDKLGSWMEPVGGLPPQAEGPPADADERLLEALANLRADEDTHWTRAGLPDCNALTEACGFPVTRKAVEGLAPGLTRESVAPGD